MGFDDRNYHFYLIFGENKIWKEPWLENEWFNNFEPLFDKIIEISSYKKDTGLRVLEMAKENETDKYYKEYKMGKLNWDQKSHEQWTLKTEDKRCFMHFESWTPRWTICDKINKAPDIYLSFHNEKSLGNNSPLQFDILASIAISEDIGNADMELIKKISEKFNSKRTVYVKKTWFGGKIDENNKWNLKDWINYICSWNGIYKDAVKLNIHTVEFNKIEFEPYWKIIY
jgi:hypothetical protein